jgi:hypothetical protein
VRSRAILSLVFLPLLLSSCGSDPNAPNAGCDGNVLVGVTPGATPEFQWWPSCAVQSLVILAGVGPHPFGQYNPTWAVESRPDAQGLPTNRLESGIQFGETPPSGRQVTAPIPLVPGQPYTVYLNVYSPNQTGTNVGRVTFMP